jgi:hypothetical protein
LTDAASSGAARIVEALDRLGVDVAQVEADRDFKL